MNYILFDQSENWKNLLPLTFTRPISDLRVGILNIKEKWEKYLPGSFSYKTSDYLSSKYSLQFSDINIYIDGSLLPNPSLIESIKQLTTNQALTYNNRVIAYCTNNKDSYNSTFNHITYSGNLASIEYPWDIFSQNGNEINADLKLLFPEKPNRHLNETNNILGGENIYIEEGVTVNFATINATKGPVYLGAGSEVMEGAVIRGPFALCKHSTLKLSAKVYGPVTIGPHCKVGGEISESVILGYSNKAHDGYLGNSVIGEWCNLGADTNTSNLKNNYEIVKAWNYQNEKFLNTGLQFCGLIMGDHSKCGINTMFNTGTVVGVSANIFGSGFPRNFIPSFSWGGAMGYKEYNYKKALEVAQKVMERRKLKLEQIDIDILQHIFTTTGQYRRF